MVSCVITCLAGVLLCSELVREAQLQSLEDKYLAAAKLCSHQVILSAFFRKLSSLVDLLSARHRDYAEASAAGAGVSLESLFRDRSGVVSWFVRGLADSLAISESARWPAAKDNATAWLLHFNAGPNPLPSPGVAATPAAATSVSSGQSKPCIYSFLEQFQPALGFSCKVQGCSYMHTFPLGEDAYLDAVRLVVQNAGPASGLGSRKSEVLNALSSSNSV
jgi:hypothetical protein